MRTRIAGRCGGFTYIGVLFAIALAGIALALAAQVWRTNSQRAKEAQLLFIGGQYMQAIERYHRQSSGGVRQYPKNLDDLLLDRRYPDVRRYIRQLYPDPMTGKADWILVRATDGGITGVYSRSTEKPLLMAAMVNGVVIGGGDKYSDWHFVYDASAGSAVERQAGGNAAPAPVVSGDATDQAPAQSTSPSSKPDAGCVMVLVGDRVFCQSI
jgi:type II secretory pathway pseudopilin PulG